MKDPLVEALRLQRRAAKTGFDWPHSPHYERVLWRKLQEEIRELREVRHQRKAAREELGDLLFMVVNVARYFGLDPVAALRAGNRKFSRRFSHILKHCASLPRRGHPQRLTVMERLWREAKQQEKAPIP